MSLKGTQIALIVAGVTVVALAAFVVLRQPKPAKDTQGLDEDTHHSTSKSASDDAAGSKTKSIDVTTVTEDSKTALDEKELHAKIEEYDQKGKAFFKNKKFLEAADTFTAALDMIKNNESTSSSSLERQVITLTNNRSAMYEKAKLPELALEDCQAVLELDLQHSRARLRKLRILESLHRTYDALVEVCALQLLFMQQNRDKLRRGLNVGTPPVPNSKLEELLEELTPSEVKTYMDKIEQETFRPLPSNYTILQLLKSYTGYNAWMAQAAKDGSVETIQASKESRQLMLLKRGRRHVYDGAYEDAKKDFLEAYGIVKDRTDLQAEMPEDTYARLLEWTGMVKHWSYDLDEAIACYEACSALEPLNAELMVKQAGVQMDAGKQEQALKLFDRALTMDPDAVDALLHRANLRMLQQNTEAAKKDLERCLELRPNHVLARLRLVAVLTATNHADAAKKHLDMAERADPESSEVHSYRGELCFTQGEVAQARTHFEKAISLEPSNPTPYVNAALAVLNIPPPPGGTPDAAAAIDFLEQAIAVDPQFQAAYVQLGQLRLGTATNLQAAREVIQLYDQGLKYCRSPQEIKDLVGMRMLTTAQVDAATMLKMETFSMQ